MYNVVNKKCPLNYLSTQCRVQLTVQCITFKWVQGGYIFCWGIFRITFTVQLKLQYKGKY